MGFLKDRAQQQVFKVEDEGNPEGMIKALRHKDREVRWVAVSALARMQEALDRGDPVDAFGQHVKLPRPRYSGPRIAQALAVAVQDEDAGVVASAAQVLGKLGAPGLGPLSEALRSASSHSTKVLVEALAEARKWAESGVGDKRGDEAVLRRAEEALIAALADRDSAVREAAARGLHAYLDDDPATGPLISALEDDDPLVRMAAAKSLSCPAALGPLLDVLDDDNEDVRATVAQKLGYGERGVDSLMEALRSGSPRVRKAAAQGLGIFGGHASSRGWDPERAVASLVAALKDDDADVRREVVVALTRFRGEEKVVKGSRWNYVHEGDLLEDAIQGLRAALKDDNAGVRVEAINALARLSKEAAIDGLRAAANDEDAGVRAEALAALKRFGGHLP